MCFLSSFYHQQWIDTWRSEFKRQTVFFLPIDPRDKDHQDPATIDFNKPRRAQYMHSAWRKHQDAVFWVDFNLAIQKGLNILSTRSNAIIPRPPPKISFQHDHDWNRGKVQLGSTIKWSQPEGMVVRSLEEKFNTQRSPNLPNQSQNQSVIDQCNLIICLKIPVLNKLTMDQGNLTAQVHGQWKNNMLLTNIVKLRHSTRTTSSIVQSTRGTLTSTFQAYRILQWNNCTASAFETWNRKSRTTRIGTLFNETYNKVNHSIPSTKNQKKWFMKLGTSFCVN